jgi:syndecan 1/collagen type V/XI/XXIV/XXVII alpha
MLYLLLSLQGPYVLVLVAFQHGPHFRLMPGVWCVRAYQSLPRAFRKNVKHVLLLQPSLMVRAVLALLYPFVSSKAHAKVKQVRAKDSNSG